VLDAAPSIKQIIHTLFTPIIREPEPSRVARDSISTTSPNPLAQVRYWVAFSFTPPLPSLPLLDSFSALISCIAKRTPPSSTGSSGALQIHDPSLSPSILPYIIRGIYVPPRLLAVGTFSGRPAAMASIASSRSWPRDCSGAGPVQSFQGPSGALRPS
jgi:hypothetical protein